MNTTLYAALAKRRMKVPKRKNIKSQKIQLFIFIYLSLLNY